MECRAFHIAAAVVVVAGVDAVVVFFVTVDVENVQIDFDCEQTFEAIVDELMWMLATSMAIVLSRWQNALAAVQAMMTHHVLSHGIRIAVIVVVIVVMVDIAIYVELVKVVSTNTTSVVVTIAVMNPRLSVGLERALRHIIFGCKQRGSLAEHWLRTYRLY
uniref:Uncharacterized protein n=1 Tax=Glossina brevipalpis TaxID=37001 RepID=A0A1A9WRV2_9MUSC